MISEKQSKLSKMTHWYLVMPRIFEALFYDPTLLLESTSYLRLPILGLATQRWELRQWTDICPLAPGLL